MELATGTAGNVTGDVLCDLLDNSSEESAVSNNSVVSDTQTMMVRTVTLLYTFNNKIIEQMFVKSCTSTAFCVILKKIK